MMEPTPRNVPKTCPGGHWLAVFALALVAMAAAGLALVPGGVIFNNPHGWHAYPADRDEALVRGTYYLPNQSRAAIDTIHLLACPGVETAVRFDRPARVVRTNAEPGHWSYALAWPLGPGDSLRLHFKVQYQAPTLPLHGFHLSVADNGTSCEPLLPRRPDGTRWLPLPGYQPAGTPLLICTSTHLHIHEKLL